MYYDHGSIYQPSSDLHPDRTQCNADGFWYSCTDSNCNLTRTCASNSGLEGCACPTPYHTDGNIHIRCLEIGTEKRCNLAPSAVSSTGKQCPNGCAQWSSLAKDGNTHAQSDADAKFASGKAPDSRCCAFPQNDAGPFPWCYCRGTNDASWQHCDAPAKVKTTCVQHAVNYDTAPVELKCGVDDKDFSGGLITKIDFADYGNPVGACNGTTAGTFTPEPSCTCGNYTTDTLGKLCLGQPYCSLPTLSGPNATGVVGNVNPTPCVMWRQTGNCDPDGPRQPRDDKSCDVVIQDGISGYCECAGGIRKKRAACSVGAYATCNLACASNANLYLCTNGISPATSDGHCASNTTVSLAIVVTCGEIPSFCANALARGPTQPTPQSPLQHPFDHHVVRLESNASGRFLDFADGGAPADSPWPNTGSRR
jgi:hypothetical protein